MKVLNAVLLTVSVFWTLFLTPGHTANAQNKKIGINTVVIDAGHGGRDGGAVGRIYKEKDINLDVALQLEQLIKNNYSDVKVILTRRTDVLIDLYERGNIANRAGADLFISIHVNSNKSSAPSGVSTYVMGVDKTGKNLDEAMKENDVITLEDDYSAKYQGYTPGSSESFIIFSLMQYSYQAQSCLLADALQKHFTKNTSMVDRGVRQAGFLVLWKAAMPSILAEFGFISNATEEKYIGSKKGRETYARCLFNAFSEYKVRSEGRGTLIVLNGSESSTDGSGSGDSNDQHVRPDSAQKESAAAESAPDGSVVYRIQVTSSDRKLPKNSSVFGPYRGEVKEIVVKNRYKYFVGGTSIYKEALSLQAKVRQSIRDAFVVPFAGEVPITMEEARRRER